MRTQIQLTERQAAGLKERAAREKVSMAELIRRSVDELLATERNSEDEKWERAMRAVGFLKSDVHDLSINHDKYLIEAYASEPPAK